MVRRQTRKRQTRRRQSRRRQTSRKQSSRRQSSRRQSRRRQTRRRQTRRRQSGGGWYFNVSGDSIGLRPEVRSYDDMSPPVLPQTGAGKRSRRARKSTRRVVRRFAPTNLVNNTFGCRQPVWDASCV